jgi:hypothetical protein
MPLRVLELAGFVALDVTGSGLAALLGSLPWLHTLTLGLVERPPGRRVVGELCPRLRRFRSNGVVF